MPNPKITGPYLVLAALLRTLEQRSPGLLNEVFMAIPSVLDGSNVIPLVGRIEQSEHRSEMQEAGEFLEWLIRKG